MNWSQNRPEKCHGVRDTSGHCGSPLTPSQEECPIIGFSSHKGQWALGLVPANRQGRGKEAEKSHLSDKLGFHFSSSSL